MNVLEQAEVFRREIERTLASDKPDIAQAVKNAERKITTPEGEEENG
jgi:hypothetical protein